MSEWWNDLNAFAQDTMSETIVSAPQWLWIAIRIALIFLAARLLASLCSRIIRAIRNFQIKHAKPERQRRLNSLWTLTHSVLRYIIYLVAIIISISLFGFGTSISGVIAGVGGIALGIGAQSVIKDVVTGFLMLFENQFHVGEYVEIGGVKGTVQAIAIRVTYIRAFRGDVHIIPNGSIDKVINYSRGAYLAIVDINVSHEEDLERAIEIMQQEASAYAENCSDILEPPVVVGAVAQDENAVTLRLTAKTTAPEHFVVERELLARIKRRFADEHIAFPYPHRVLLHGKIIRKSVAPDEAGQEANE